MGEVKKIKLGEKPCFYSAPRWSPDGKKIAYVDNHPDHLVRRHRAEEARPGGQGRLLDDSGRAAAWVARQQVDRLPRSLKNLMYAIYIYSIADNKSSRMTDGHERRRLSRFRQETASSSTSPPAPIPARPANSTCRASSSGRRAASTCWCFPRTRPLPWRPKAMTRRRPRTRRRRVRTPRKIRTRRATKTRRTAKIPIGKKG